MYCAGMPRRIPDYSPQFADFNMISSIGGFAFGVTQLIFVGVVLHCVYRSKVNATPRVWEGSRGLEWTLDSPPAYHSFNTPPEVTCNALSRAD
jgi:cytochrome c oxidase subunit 1